MTSILSITDSSQLTEFCTVILPTIWTLNISKSRQFIQKVLKATQISCTCILVALYYIHRLRSAYPHIDLSIGSEIRLFTTALILANKYLEDSTFTNKTWSSVSGIPVKELNRMEAEFLSALDYNICISQHQFYQWTMQCQQLWSLFLMPVTQKRSLEEEEEVHYYQKKSRSSNSQILCKPILSWSSSVSALAASRIMNTYY
ncbi:unnamed protein product [Rhizopus microsporus]|uniref:Cyclin-domain-containing protein n=1 Tax=Rhizopus microsporus TaxID=58291 RepID=A0A1X0S688_RHIZD|nr:hypothetical protein BCV71DRAFT_290053 [Rhizopus microsporus]